MVQRSARQARVARQPLRNTVARRPRVSGARASALLAAMVLGGARVGAAHAEPMALTWHAPPGCPTAAAVAASVKRNLATAGPELAPFVAVVGVRGPTAGRWQASMLFQSGDIRAERQFDAESCEALAGAAAFIIALWAEGGAGAPPNTATAAPARPVQQSENSEALAQRRATSPGPQGLVLMLDGLLDWGTMPDPPGGGMEAAGGRLWTVQGWHLRALVGLGFFPTRRTPDTGVAQANFRLYEASGRGCLTVAVARLEVGPCAGVALAIMDGFGTAFRASTQPWISLLGSALVSWQISPDVDVFGRADLVVPTTRTSFSSAAYMEEIYRVPALAERGALGLALHFE